MSPIGGGSVSPTASVKALSPASTCASTPSVMRATVTWHHVTGAQTETVDRQRVAPLATGIVLPFAAIAAVLHCAASILGDGYWFDEVYVLAIGRPLRPRWPISLHLVRRPRCASPLCWRLPARSW